jgi:hypothetical protein
MDTRKKVETVMRVSKLEDVEREILRVLLSTGYDGTGKALGRDGAIPATVLAKTVFASAASDIETAKRELRDWINRLIFRHKIPIMCESGRGGGYYLPASSEEVQAHRRRFRRRAMTGLLKDARSGEGYAETMVQLTLGFEREEGQEIRARYGMGPDEDVDPVPAWHRVLTSLLDHVASDPDAYAEQIRELRNKYPTIFVPREKVEEIRDLTARLQGALQGL